MAVFMVDITMRSTFLVALLLIAALPLTQGTLFEDDPCPGIIGCIACKSPPVCDTCDAARNFQEHPVSGQCQCIDGDFLDPSKHFCKPCAQVI